MYNCDYEEHENGGVAVLVADEPEEIRIDKVLTIRRELRAGRYHIADRLDTVVDKLLDLLGG